MQQYIYLIRPSRPGFQDTITRQESEKVQEHFNYLKELQARNRLILAGRCDDAAFGIIIFEAENAQEAETIVRFDPAVKAGVFTAEFHAYRVALMRGEAK